MAKEIILKVGLEGTDETISNVQRLEQEIEKLNEQREKLISSPSVSSGEFSKQLDEIDSQISKLEKTYQSATGKAEKFEKTQKNLEGVAKTLSGSINLVSGTLATFGVKNEEVEKTLLRVQAASNFATGLKDLQEGFKALNTTFGTLTKTMLANPFILIATVVASLVVAFVPLDDILKAITDTASGFFKVLGFGGDTALATAEDFDKLLETQNAYVASLENSNRESERNIKILEAQGASYSVIAAEQINIINNQLKIAALQKQDAQLIAELTKDISIFNDLREKAQTRVNELTEKEKDLQVEKKVIAINASKEIQKTNEENTRKELELLKEAEQAKVAVTEEGTTARFEAEINAINAVEQFQILKAKQLGITENGITILLQENIDKRKKLEEDYYKFVNKLRTTDIEEYDAKKKEEEALNKRVSDGIKALDNSTYQTKAQLRQQELNELAKEASTSQMYAQKTATVISDLGNLVFDIKKRNLEKGSKEEEKVAKKQFQFNKALQLGLAVMDGFKAITASLAQSPIAIGPVPNPAGIASLAFAGVTSALNIAKIAATKFEGGASANSSNTTTPTIPNISTSGSITPTQFQPNTFNTGNSQQQTFGGVTGAGGGNILRAYVSESDINNTQVRLRNIRQASEL